MPGFLAGLALFAVFSRPIFALIHFGVSLVSLAKRAPSQFATTCTDFPSSVLQDEPTGPGHIDQLACEQKKYAFGSSLLLPTIAFNVESYLGPSDRDEWRIMTCDCLDVLKW